MQHCKPVNQFTFLVAKCITHQHKNRIWLALFKASQQTLCYDVHTGNSDGFRNAVQAAESFPTTPSSLSDMPSTRTEQTTIKPSRDQQFQHTLNNNSRSSTSPRNAETKYRLTSPINQQVSKPLSNNTEDETWAGRYDNSQYGPKSCHNPT